jgi:DNA repair exonuclease SbcCD nuclease subunit
MNRFLFFADLHCHNWAQYHTRLENGLNSRFSDCLSIIHQAGQAVAQYGVSNVFFLGDLFESRKALDIDVFSQTHLEIRELAKVVPENVWILKGNHDCHSRIGDMHSIEGLRDIPKVHVISEPDGELVIGDTRIAAFPYEADIELLKRMFSLLSDVDLVLLHQPILEGVIGNYSHIAGELSVADLPMDRCKYVIAGDYHKRQFFGPGNRVHYVGSPLQLKIDEAGEEKGFTLLDTQSWQLSTIPTEFPKFHLFESPAAATAGWNDVQTRDFVRIQYSVADRAEAELLKKEHPRVQLDEQVDTEVLARTSAAVIENNADLCREYIAQRNKGLPEDKLLEVALDLLEGE